MTQGRRCQQGEVSKEARSTTPHADYLNQGVAWSGALNFRDVMLAYGRLNKDLMHHQFGGDIIGMEFSGTVSRWATLLRQKNDGRLTHT